MGKMKDEDIDNLNLESLAKEYPSLDAEAVKRLLTGKERRLNNFTVFGSLNEMLTNSPNGLPEEISSLFFTVSSAAYVAITLINDTNKDENKMVSLQELLAFMAEKWADLYKLGEVIYKITDTEDVSDLLEISKKLSLPVKTTIKGKQTIH